MAAVSSADLWTKIMPMYRENMRKKKLIKEALCELNNKKFSELLLSYTKCMVLGDLQVAMEDILVSGKFLTNEDNIKELYAQLKFKISQTIDEPLKYGKREVENDS